MMLAPNMPLPDSRYRPLSDHAGFKLLRRDGPCAPPPAEAGRFGRMRPEGVPGT
jgi:hypothetical protein